MKEKEMEKLYKTCKILIKCEDFKFYNDKKIKVICKKGRKKQTLQQLIEKKKFYNQ